MKQSLLKVDQIEAKISFNNTYIESKVTLGEQQALSILSSLRLSN